MASRDSVDKSEIVMEGSTPAQEAEPGTLKVSLAATPGECLHWRHLVVTLL